MKKANLAILIVVLLLIFLGASFWHKKAGSSMPQPAPAQTTSTSSQKTSQPQPAPAAAIPAAKPLSYSQALRLYPYRIQFVSCRGTVGSTGGISSGTLIIKRGSKFMLDNRDQTAHTIAFKTQSFRLGGFGFAIATARDLGTYPITCGGGGSAYLNVQP